MTATAEQLDVLKQSLNNFRDLQKSKQMAGEEEYIEEIFEDMNEDIQSSMVTSAHSRDQNNNQPLQAARSRLEDHKNSQLQLQPTRNLAAGKKTNRPISATYNLAQLQFGQPQGVIPHHQPTNSHSLRQIDRAQVINAVNQENKNL